MSIMPNISQMIQQGIQIAMQQLSPRVPEANIRFLGGNLSGRGSLCTKANEVALSAVSHAALQPAGVLMAGVLEPPPTEAEALLGLPRMAAPSHVDAPAGVLVPPQAEALLGHPRIAAPSHVDAPAGVLVPPPSALTEAEALLGHPRIAAPSHLDAFEADMLLAVAARPEAKKKVLKRPSAAGAPHEPVLKRPAGSPMAGGHDARPAVPLDGHHADVLHEPVLKRPAGSPMAGGHDARPAVPLDGHHADVLLYLGGRIYDDSKSRRLRCYRQIGDKVEKSISYKTRSRADCFLQAFQEIEMDPRTAVEEEIIE